jgi:DNA-binding HxlR family transcriptional regulator
VCFAGVGSVSAVNEYTRYESSACSVARTAELIGEPWTLLVLRDLANGVHRFDDLVDHLGVARNVLAKRLDKLVDAGIAERVPYRDPGQRSRSEYRLSPAGWELQPVLVAIHLWGDRHLSAREGPPTVLEHAGCGARVGIQLLCAEGHVLGAGDRLQARHGPGARLRAAAG